MSTPSETSDHQILELLSRMGGMTVTEMAVETKVTATAVRQRLARLMSQGLIDRKVSRRGRGRPNHRYQLSEKGRRHFGTNFADLALILWEQIKSIKDPEIRKGLLSRIAEGLAAAYADKVGGGSPRERMQSLACLFAERSVPLEVTGGDELPVLTVVHCPYPDLAEHDRGICAVEKMLFERLLGQDVRLARHRFDGHPCCEFATN